MTYLLDSNVIIYSARPESVYQSLRVWVQHAEAAVSALSRVEVVGYSHLTPADNLYSQAAFAALPNLPITDAVLSQAVLLRQHYRLKTPDAIIAATALINNLQLLTVDADFTSIAHLSVRNSLSI